MLLVVCCVVSHDIIFYGLSSSLGVSYRLSFILTCVVSVHLQYVFSCEYLPILVSSSNFLVMRLMNMVKSVVSYI